MAIIHRIEEYAGQGLFPNPALEDFDQHHFIPIGLGLGGKFHTKTDKIHDVWFPW
jgi:hypothetical protein